MDRGAWQATVHGVARVGHDLATKTTKYRKEINTNRKENLEETEVNQTAT